MPYVIIQSVAFLKGEWCKESVAAGRKWVVTMDERYNTGWLPERDHWRKQALMQTGRVASVSGAGTVSLGSAPHRRPGAVFRGLR